VKALSLTQPWASLVVCGAKEIETRSWPCPRHVIGRRIAIHAAKGIKRGELIALAATWNFRGALIEKLGRMGDPRDPFKALPFGAVIGTARIHSCERTESLTVGVLDTRRAPAGEAVDSLYSWTERMFGNYAPGRWAWLLDDAEEFEKPISTKGALGLWEWKEAT
jgi:hypothetical protein